MELNRKQAVLNNLQSANVSIKRHLECSDQNLAVRNAEVMDTGKSFLADGCPKISGLELGPKFQQTGCPAD